MRSNRTVCQAQQVVVAYVRGAALHVAGWRFGLGGGGRTAASAAVVVKWARGARARACACVCVVRDTGVGARLLWRVSFRDGSSSCLQVYVPLASSPAPPWRQSCWETKKLSVGPPSGPWALGLGPSWAKAGFTSRVQHTRLPTDEGGVAKPRSSSHTMPDTATAPLAHAPLRPPLLLIVARRACRPETTAHDSHIKLATFD